MSSVQSLQLDANGTIVKAAVHLRMLWHFIFMSYKIKVLDEGSGELRLYGIRLKMFGET